MNTLTADGFCATRQPNGDVWITSRARKRVRAGQLAPEESQPIVIPKEQCEQLAILLRFGSLSALKTDYSRRDGEPE